MLTPKNSPRKLLELLQLIYRHGPIGRPALGQLTGHSTFLISKLCDQLINADFITIAGTGSSSGGRRASLLSVDHGLGKLISVDLGAVNLRIVLTDLGGNTLAYHKLPSRVTEGPEVALGGLVTQISQILNEERVSVHDLAGIGIGISAVLDRTTGITRSWPKVPKWTNIPVQQIIADHFNTLVAIDDSVRTSAMVERRTGGTADARHFVYINIGAGTGAAIFLNNELYTGNNGFAGEFGHMLVAEQGPPCACGGRGCVETLASGSAMIRSAKEGFVEAISPALWELCQADANNISVELMSKAATKGDRFCLEVFNRAGGFLGTAILSLANLLDPQLIVLGGGAAVAAGELLMEPIRRVLKHRGLGMALPEIRLSNLQDSNWATGGALLVAEKVLTRKLLNALHLLEIQ